MDFLCAIFLGVLQGATEFLPVSSSGHLVLAETFLGIRQAGLTFDVALHLGTVSAILVYFRDDFLMMAKALFTSRQERDEEAEEMRRLALYICIATVPGVIAGLLFGKAVETTLRHPGVVASTLAGVGVLLLLAEKKGERSRELQSITLKDALLIGLSQAIAIVPGVSRSGITMTTGLFRGLDRPAVARFSFLLSAPIILGAGVYHIGEIVRQGSNAGQFWFFVAGFLSAAVSGYLFIAFLLQFVRTRTFKVFAYYRFVLAGLVCLALVWR